MRSKTRAHAFPLYSQGWEVSPSHKGMHGTMQHPISKRPTFLATAYSPTGKNLYMLINQNLTLIGSAAITTPEVPVAPVSLTSLTFGSNTNAAQTLAFAASPTGANTVMIVEATRPLSPALAHPAQHSGRLLQLQQQQQHPLTHSLLIPQFSEHR